MTKKSRKIIFLVLFLLFISLAPAMVMYCLGWRFDWTEGKITEPGMLYLKASPKNAEIYLEGKQQKKTDIFFGSILMEGLAPREYQVEVRKPGYHIWKKTLSVGKRQVTEAKNILLIPQSPNLVQIAQNIEKIFLTPDTKKIILKEDTPLTDQKMTWELKIIDTETNLKSHLISLDDLKIKIPTAKKGQAEPQIVLSSLKFSENSKRILIEIKVSEKTYFYVVTLETGEVTPIIFKTVPEEIFFGTDDNKLYFLTPSDKNQKGGKIFFDINELHTKTGEISTTLLSNVMDLDVSEGRIYLLDNSGFVFKSNFSFTNMEKLNIIPIILEKEADYELTSMRDRIFLEEGETLLGFNRDRMIFEKIFDSVNEFSLSPDSKQLLGFNKEEIWVVYLEDKIEQPHKEKGEKMLLAGSQENIKNAFWLTNSYIAFNNGDKVRISETDDRGELNIVDFLEAESPEIYWLDEKLYVFSEQTLSVFSGLIP